jgi:hypothetical protein
MFDYSGSVPGGLLFAVYFSPGGNSGLFSPCSTLGLVATPGAIALESNVCSFSGNIGIEICWLEQAWAVAKHSGIYPSQFIHMVIFHKFNCLVHL